MCHTSLRKGHITNPYLMDRDHLGPGGCSKDLVVPHLTIPGVAQVCRLVKGHLVCLGHPTFIHSEVHHLKELLKDKLISLGGCQLVNHIVILPVVHQICLNIYLPVDHHIFTHLEVHHLKESLKDHLIRLGEYLTTNHHTVIHQEVHPTRAPLMYLNNYHPIVHHLVILLEVHQQICLREWLRLNHPMAILPEGHLKIVLLKGLQTLQIFIVDLQLHLHHLLVVPANHLMCQWKRNI